MEPTCSGRYPQTALLWIIERHYDKLELSRQRALVEAVRRDDPPSRFAELYERNFDSVKRPPLSPRPRPLENTLVAIGLIAESPGLRLFDDTPRILILVSTWSANHGSAVLW
jgi:hypothetical protein